MGYHGLERQHWEEKIAQSLNWPFLDLDEMIEEMHFRIKGEKLLRSKIMKEYGEGYFRSLETLALKECIKKTHHVIALGGGTLQSQENQNLSRDLGLICYLKVPLEVLRMRLEKDPLPTHFSSLEQLIKERVLNYEKCADIIFTENQKIMVV